MIVKAVGILSPGDMGHAVGYNFEELTGRIMNSPELWRNVSP